MVNPLSNDKNPSASSQRSSNAEQKAVQQRQQQRTETTDPVASQTSDTEDTVRLSDTGRIFNQTVDRARQSTGEVATPEAAIALAGSIQEQFEQDGAQALSVHRNIRADQLANLLHTAPA